MNYGKRGIVNQAKAISSGTNRWGNKFGLFGFCFLLAFVIGLGVIGVSAGIGVFNGIKDTAKPVEEIDMSPKGMASYIVDIEGNQTNKLVAKDANRIPIGQDQITDTLAHAFVAIEDERFYEHNGIDIHGIIRAGFKFLSSGNASQGASTITQQLIKNNAFEGWVTETNLLQKVKRKIQEQYLAIQIEKEHSKEEILTEYLNTINLGQNTLGVEAASRRYFNKHADELNLSECAVIAAITSAPTRYNPISNPDNNQTRRKIVLNKMLEQGYITQVEYDEAMADDVYSRIQAVNSENNEDNAVNSWFDDALIDQLLKDFQEKLGMTKEQATAKLYSGGVKVISTQDPRIQKICDEVYENEELYPAGTKYLLNVAVTVKKADGSIQNYSSEMMQNYFKDENNDTPYTSKAFNRLFNSPDEAQECADYYIDAIVGEGEELVGDPYVRKIPQPQVSITVEDQHTGHIVALVGGRGEKTDNRAFNRATASPRQPGSTFKIMSTYLPGIDSGKITLASVFQDVPISYGKGGKVVRDWWGSSNGEWYTARRAITRSANVPTVQMFAVVTPELGYEYLQKLGFTTLVGEEGYKGDKGVNDIHLATALGGLTNGVYNSELNAGYATIANGGVYIKPKLYTKVLDYDGSVLIDNEEPETREVISEAAAFVLTSAMKDVVTGSGGTGSSVNFGTTPIAGKTGTTSDYNDVWFAGYTNYYTATTWTGFDNNEKLKTSDEKNFSKTMWRAVMEKIHEGLPSSEFPQPSSGLVTRTICSESGKLPIEGVCDGTLKSEIFVEGTEPTETCDVHYQGEVCAFDGRPASEWCPFKTQGVCSTHPAPPAEAAALYVNGVDPNSSYTTTTDEEGNTVTVPNTCHHTVEFMQQDGIEGILAGERAEMERRAAEAAAAAAAEGQAPPAGGDPNAGLPAPPAPPGPTPPPISEDVAAGN
ncbi:glycosyl transferase [Butyrivibrio sp. X503]|uniref:transglycosylase domain-containing protein n=1 Tax=Butyrivibrio sp. X503 TaxID=2364878 RepID=UPI000EA88A87|nr:transglycosylase domain-containing protein [Butyrivibrio sp. X503]RKM58270.1 glycosyl transferase [Butyrivibrio sp. X503]